MLSVQNTSLLKGSALLFGLLGTSFLFTNLQQNAPIGDIVDGSLQAALETKIKQSNPAASSAIALVGALKYGMFNQAADGAIVGKDGWLFTSEEFEQSANFYENIAQAAKHVTSVTRELGELGIQVMPVIVPDKADVYDEKLRTARPVDVAARKRSFLDQLTASGVSFVDATGPLRAQKTAGDVFIKDDTHWSPLGSQAVAQHVAKRLNTATIQRTEVTTVAGPETVFDGDLLAYVSTGAFRPFVGPSQTLLQRYETTVKSEAGLFGDVSIDVVLVGTSFSAKPDWHFDGFLKQALQTDILNFAEEGQGPFAPMDAFLASETYLNTPPKLIIWEIPVRYTSKDTSK